MTLQQNSNKRRKEKGILQTVTWNNNLWNMRGHKYLSRQQKNETDTYTTSEVKKKKKGKRTQMVNDYHLVYSRKEKDKRAVASVGMPIPKLYC